MKVPSIKFHENPPSGNRADTREQTDMRKVMCAFRDDTNEP
jgi:hypothetical protein